MSQRFSPVCADEISGRSMHRSSSQVVVVELVQDEVDRLDEDDNDSYISGGTEAEDRILASTHNGADEEEGSEDAAPKGRGKVEEVPATPAVTKALSERHHLEFMVIVFGGIALAFNAGFVNGSTYLIGNIPVSHVTGTTTKAGLFLAQHEMLPFSINLCLIVSYIFGASITGAMMPTDSFKLGREYGPLFVIGSGLFLLSSLSTYFAPDSKLFYYFAAMACGLQNGMTTKYSGSIIRTTHMTGASTDIGLVLGRIAMGDHKERWKLLVLVPLLSSFLIGGTVSVYVHNHLGTLSLLVNVVVFFSIGIAYSVVVGKEMHIPFWRAMFGFYVTVEKKVVDSGGHVKRVANKTKHAVKMVIEKVKNPLH